MTAVVYLIIAIALGHGGGLPPTPLPNHTIFQKIFFKNLYKFFSYSTTIQQNDSVLDVEFYDGHFGRIKKFLSSLLH